MPRATQEATPVAATSPLGPSRCALAALRADPAILLPPTPAPPAAALLSPRLATAMLAPPLVQALDEDRCPPVEAEPTPSLVIVVPSTCIARDDLGRFLGWMDYEHCVMSGRTMATARWFDDLFGDWYAEQASMQVRVVLAPVWDRKAGSQFNTSVQADVQLPNASRRLRLVVGDERDDVTGNIQNVSPEQQKQTSTSPTAALRFVPLALGAAQIHTDVGLRGGPDVFVRARLRHSWTLGYDSSVRFSQMLRYTVKDTGRTVTELGVEHVLPHGAVLAFTNTFSYWQQEDSQVGARWNQGISYARPLGEQESIAYGLATEGITRPSWARDSYGLYMTFRHTLWRRWLYYELEPRLTKYRLYDWSTVPSFTARLEIQFGRK